MLEHLPLRGGLRIRQNGPPICLDERPGDLGPGAGAVPAVISALGVRTGSRLAHATAGRFGYPKRRGARN
jgi:hypothetical protein